MPPQLEDPDQGHDTVVLPCMGSRLPDPDWSLLSPTSPLFKTKEELQKHYVKQAQRSASQHQLTARLPCLAGCREIGTSYGMGIGLYFQVIWWLKCMSLWMMLAALPFVIIINTSAFTDASHRRDHSAGVQQFQSFSLYGFTFAAIVDDSTDNGALQWIHCKLGGVWTQPFAKGDFLTWISLLDAGATAAFFLMVAFCYWQANILASAVGSNTLQVSDFSVILVGLPSDSHAKEIGEHFGQFGTVMDVVVMKDVGCVLSWCKETSQLEQRGKLLKDQRKLYDPDLYRSRSEKMAGTLDRHMGRVNAELEGEGFPLKAAFVTFDLVAERDACLANLPQGWLSSRFMPVSCMFRNAHRFTAVQAATPDEYIFENVGSDSLSRFLRMALVRFLLLAFILIFATAIARLSCLSVRESSAISWRSAALQADTASAMTWSQPPSAVGNASWGAAVGNTSSRGSIIAYCSALLPGSCSTHLGAEAGSAVNASFGRFMQWSSASDQILFERASTTQLESCTAQGPSRCSDSGCLPCYCLGLQAAATTSSPEWVARTRGVCASYIDVFDIRSWAVRIGVSLTIALVNAAVKEGLSRCVRHERRWTRSKQERSYALLCYLSKLINTVAVLLVVNASAVGRATERSSSRSPWLHYLLLDGKYSDFDPGWYENVGLSIMVLMLINCITPVLNVFLTLAKKWLSRFWVSRCMRNASQAHFDTAWAIPRFTLEQRVADAMLNTSLALLFGTGMPIVYLILFVTLLVTDLVDRFFLLRENWKALRYNGELPTLVIGLLPWAAIGHCAFGLWMHTHFRPTASVGPPLDRLMVVAAALPDSGLWGRVTQPNGLAMLWLLAALLLWMLVLSGTEPLVHHPACAKPDTRRVWSEQPPQQQAPTILTSVVSHLTLRSGNELGQRRCLGGVPTYQLPHNPRYRAHFSGQLCQEIWAKALGDERFTRLRSITYDRCKPSDFLVLHTPQLSFTGPGLDLESLASHSRINPLTAPAVSAAVLLARISAPHPHTYDHDQQGQHDQHRSWSQPRRHTDHHRQEQPGAFAQHDTSDEHAGGGVQGRDTRATPFANQQHSRSSPCIFQTHESHRSGIHVIDAPATAAAAADAHTGLATRRSTGTLAPSPPPLLPPPLGARAAAAAAAAAEAAAAAALTNGPAHLVAPVQHRPFHSPTSGGSASGNSSGHLSGRGSEPLPPRPHRSAPTAPSREGSARSSVGEPFFLPRTCPPPSCLAWPDPALLDGTHPPHAAAAAAALTLVLGAHPADTPAHVRTAGRLGGAHPTPTAAPVPTCLLDPNPFIAAGGGGKAPTPFLDSSLFVPTVEEVTVPRLRSSPDHRSGSISHHVPDRGTGSAVGASRSRLLPGDELSLRFTPLASTTGSPHPHPRSSRPAQGRNDLTLSSTASLHVARSLAVPSPDPPLSPDRAPTSCHTALANTLTRPAGGSPCHLPAPAPHSWPTPSDTTLTQHRDPPAEALTRSTGALPCHLAPGDELTLSGIVACAQVVPPLPGPSRSQSPAPGDEASPAANQTSAPLGMTRSRQRCRPRLRDLFAPEAVDPGPVAAPHTAHHPPNLFTFAAGPHTEQTNELAADVASLHSHTSPAKQLSPPHALSSSCQQCDTLRDSDDTARDGPSADRLQLSITAS
ncbi:MAG: hypothetical protein WDW36_000372 [Sanguina aurantia]